MYRFAMYGRSNSGKTCLLATLSMGAEGLPRGFTVERIPVTGDGSDSTGSTNLSALRAGREWIDQAISRLQGGSVPEGNPPAFDGTGMMTDFQIGSPQRGTLTVRTVDYSGELISPDDEAAADSGALLLRTFLAQYDGFLILAETPTADSDNKQMLSDELRRLREAFVSLRRDDGHLETPVAVVLTKWDRYSTLAFDDPALEIDKLREFLDSHPAHASLVQSISNALETSVISNSNPDAPNQSDVGPWSVTVPRDSVDTTTDEGTRNVSGAEVANETVTTVVPDGDLSGLQHGNCAVFPASAFGRTDPDGKIERPADAQPKPFGLLEPFLWLAARRDELDVRRLMRDFEQVPELLYCVRPNRLNKLLRRADALASRIPATSGPGRVLRHVQSRAGRLWWLNRFGYTAVCVLTLSIAWCSWCAWEFESKIAEAQHPQTSEVYLRNHREWFSAWLQKPFPLTGLTSSQRTQQQIEEIDERLEALYWLPVEKADSDGRKLQAAEAYRDQMPNGRHLDEAIAMIASLNSRREQSEIEDWLRLRKRDVEFADTVVDLEAAHEALSEGLPHAQGATEDHRSRFRELRDQVAADLDRLRSQHDWKWFTRGIEKMLQANDFSSVGEELVLWPNRNADWRTYAGSFPELVMKSVDLEVARHLQNKDFDSALREVSKAGQMLADIERTLRPDEPALADVMLKAQSDTASRREKVVLREDAALYEVITGLRRVDASTTALAAACQAYPKDGVMRRDVDRYEKWINIISGRLEDVTVGVRVFWTKQYSKGTVWDGNGSKHKLTITVNDKPVVVCPRLTDAPGTLSGVVGRVHFKGWRLPSKLSLGAVLIYDGLTGETDVGSGKNDELTLKDIWKKPTKLIINPADGTKYDNEVRLEIISGVPSEPELPTWKNPSSLR